MYHIKGGYTMSKYLLFLSFVFCLLSSALGGIIHVPQDQPGIQAGINAAFPGDTILVADSTYYENLDFKGKAITVASYFLIDRDTTHIDSTIINGSQPSDPDKGSVVSFISGEDTTSILCGFTITGGNGSWNAASSTRFGGGIYCYNSGCTLLSNKIVNNSVTGPAVMGGGFAAVPLGSNAYVVLEENQIAHNTITADSYQAFGGGLWLVCNAILVNNHISYNSVVHNATNYKGSSGGVICYSLPTDRRKIIMESNKINHNSVVSKNNNSSFVSATAGGVWFYSSYGRFAKNEVNYNEVWANSDQTAGGAGMGMNEAPDSLIIEANIICKNAVKQGWGLGGGILIGVNSSPVLINNIIDGNSANVAGGVGGGLIIANSVVQLINNTITNNQASEGGGVNVRMSSTVYLMNTILWGNKAASYAGIQLEEGTVHAVHCDIQGGWTGGGNINKNPGLDADSLLNDSPCIGAGFHSFDFGGGMRCLCPATDINGRSRPYPVDTKPDMGAWESLLDTPLVGIESLPIPTIPQEYSLSQNYPNPINPSTTIEFTLPKSAFVTLKVYNLLGEEVATLVSENLSAGKYKYLWDASCTGGMASGVYLYRLKAGDPSNNSGQGFVQTRKLILLR
jgi:hypothetical protein